jgi:phosphoglycolate phosphatase
MTLRAVLFDLDGTLVDSLDDLTEAVNYMLANFSRQPLSSSQVRRLVGKGARNLVQRALGMQSSADIEQGLELFLKFNAAHIADKSRLYDGARQLLENLSHSGIRMAIISNKDAALSRLILETLAIDDFFEIICGGDTFAEMKPSPLPLMQVIGRFGIPSSQALMVGDSSNDIQAGKQAGIATIGCTWGYGELAELLGADHLAASCNEVNSILLQQEIR